MLTETGVDVTCQFPEFAVAGGTGFFPWASYGKSSIFELNQEVSKRLEEQTGSGSQRENIVVGAQGHVKPPLR